MASSDESKHRGLSLKTKIGFGAAEFSSSLTWTMLSILFLFFLTDVVGIEPAFAGFIMMIGTLWDAVTDPAVGVGSDRMRSKWGRRRPLLLATAVPYGLATWMLFTDPGLADGATKVWFIAAIMFYYTAATFLEVPYTSLTAEMTQDYAERAKLIGYRALFSQVGSIIGAASPLMLIAYFSTQTASESAGWSITGALFGLVVIFPILVTWRASRGHELKSEPVTVRWSDFINGPLKNRTFRYTMAGYTGGNIALGASGSVAIYFMAYYMNFDEAQRSIAYLFLFSCTILWIPVVTWVTMKFGKKASYILFVSAWALVQSVGIMMIGPDQTLAFYFLMFVASGGIVSISMTGLSMIPDSIEVDEYKTGLRREGLYTGTNMLVRKIGTALALWAVGIFLSAIGYVPDQVQSESTLTGIRMLYAYGTALCLVASVFFVFFLPMTEAKHALLKKAIRSKKDGQPVDDSGIKDLL